MVNKSRKVIIYSFLLVPFLIFISELSLAIFTLLFDINLPNKKIIHGGEQDTRYDIITDTYVYKKSSEIRKSENSFIDHHGLIKTIFTSDKNNK